MAESIQGTIQLQVSHEEAPLPLHSYTLSHPQTLFYSNSPYSSTACSFAQHNQLIIWCGTGAACDLSKAQHCPAQGAWHGHVHRAVTAEKADDHTLLPFMS